MNNKTSFEKAKYWVGTANNALEAGCIESAKEHLNKALQIKSYPQSSFVLPLIEKARTLASGPCPRAADQYVKSAYKILKSAFPKE